jgi:nucleoid-associated protein YgaU
MTLERLTITRCTIVDGMIAQSAPNRDEIMEVMLNPASLAQSYSISYSGNGTSTQVQGQAAAEPKFSAVDPQTLSFELIFDGTGAVPPTPLRGRPPGPVDVQEEIERLKKIVYDYNGKAHESNVVRLTWGGLSSFEGRMTSLDVEYTLFKPSGVPLRAKVKLQFVSFMTHLEANLRANRSSPDLTHEVLVRDGDTLPLLCHRIYGDSRHYVDVARANGLTTFRDLAPGTVLRFAPLN